MDDDTIPNDARGRLVENSTRNQVELVLFAISNNGVTSV